MPWEMTDNNLSIMNCFHVSPVFYINENITVEDILDWVYESFFLETCYDGTMELIKF